MDEWEDTICNPDDLDDEDEYIEDDEPSGYTPTWEIDYGEWADDEEEEGSGTDEYTINQVEVDDDDIVEPEEGSIVMEDLDGDDGTEDLPDIPS